MIPAKGYIVRAVHLKYDAQGKPALRIHTPAGRVDFYHITESPDPHPLDSTNLETITLQTLTTHVQTTHLPQTLTEEEADWFYDFDEEVTLNNGTKYVKIDETPERSLTHNIMRLRAVYKRL
ncbi:hypothetical protein HY489_04560 [Candidatus Woesearchaeota archaeon]|nr:hypothetical protein [Candidatus Woesearchaeota archaeon]